MPKTSVVTTVGLDADDTLWHNETIFRLTQERFADLLADHADPRRRWRRGWPRSRSATCRLYGYGVKGFTLSMIETAMELCDGEAPAHVVREILAAGREMLAHPVETLPGVDEALAALSDRYRLVLITKGDLLHQERKLAASGLGELFAAVEIVSEKDAQTYRRVFERHGTGAAEAVMVGNSMRSDVLPAIEAGGWAAYVPYPLVWAHEAAEAPDHPRYAELVSISGVPGWLESVAAG